MCRLPGCQCRLIGWRLEVDGRLESLRKDKPSKLLRPHKAECLPLSAVYWDNS